MSVPNVRLAGMRSDKPTGAGDQQERPGIEQWIVGFVDGEGCFSDRIVPFFERYPLVTAKADEFRRFAAVIRMMEAKLHLSV